MRNKFVTFEHESFFPTTSFCQKNGVVLCYLWFSQDRMGPTTVLPPVTSKSPSNVRWKGAFTILMLWILSSVLLFIYYLFLKIHFCKKNIYIYVQIVHDDCCYFCMLYCIFNLLFFFIRYLKKIKNKKLIPWWKVSLFLWSYWKVVLFSSFGSERGVSLFIFSNLYWRKVIFMVKNVAFTFFDTNPSENM